MRTVPAEQVAARMRLENPWWTPPHQIAKQYRDYARPREYLGLFLTLLKAEGIRRAVVLLGPRRVGKTVLIHHSIQRLIDQGVSGRRICYVSVDHPIYNGLRLDELVDLFVNETKTKVRKEPCFVFFDEIQYLRDWERHLKVLVDDMPRVKFVASGSAAAALRLKSAESGAGRFTDFLLPPLTFHEYLTLLGKDALIESVANSSGFDLPSFKAPNIHALNESFVHYLNYGGYPEIVLSEEIQSDPQRFIKSDIIDKVLLRDLPGLYGISDIQELNYLFTTLALNTAHEVSLTELSKNSGVVKNTIKKYIEYLEAAFLIRVVHRVDHSGRRFQRANYFKVYLTNPSMRSALFQPITADDEQLGSLVETAIFSQWFHSPQKLHYARWKGGEVDIVSLGRRTIEWAVEVKWSDRPGKHPEELKAQTEFCKRNGLRGIRVTTRTFHGSTEREGVRVEFLPASLYCYTVGQDLVKGKSSMSSRATVQLE